MGDDRRWHEVHIQHKDKHQGPFSAAYLQKGGQAIEAPLWPDVGEGNFVGVGQCADLELSPEHGWRQEDADEPDQQSTHQS